MRVFFRKNEYGVVYLFYDAFQIFRRKEFYLVRLCVLVKIPRDADVPALVAVLIIGAVVREHMAACIYYRVTDRNEKRLCRFAPGNPHDFPFLDAFPAPESEINQYVRVLLEHCVARCVCHFATLQHPPALAKFAALFYTPTCISFARSLMSIGYTPVKHDVQNWSSGMPVARIMPSYERKRSEVAPRYSRTSSTDFVAEIRVPCFGVSMP